MSVLLGHLHRDLYSSRSNCGSSCYLGEQGPNSISGVFSHSDLTIQQHIVDDVVNSGSESGKK